MKNQKLIEQIEIRIQELESAISHWEEQITLHKKTLLDLTQKLEEIKNNKEIK